MDQSIKAAPTARSDGEFSGMKNILTDALYELGYDDTLVNTLIARNVIDFSTVNYTSDVMDDFIEHYGESVLCGGLPNAVICESLDASLTGELGKSWRTSTGDTFQERIQQIITNPIEKLGMKVVTRHELENSITFSEELEGLKQHLTIDYTEFNSYLPDIDLVVYIPKDSRVIAVISCIVNLKDRIVEQAYWKRKLQTDKSRASIKFYLITVDLDETLKILDLPTKKRVIAETDLDGTYVMTVEELEENYKVKLFEHFIDDLKQVIEEGQ